MRWPRSVLATTALPFAVLSATATAASDGPKPLFAAADTLHLTLRAPFAALEGSSGRSTKPVPACAVSPEHEALAREVSEASATEARLEVALWPISPSSRLFSC